MIKTKLGILSLANTSQVPNRPSPLGTLMHFRLPIDRAWARLKLFDAIEEELRRYERLRSEIIEKYFEADGTVPNAAKSIQSSHPNFSKAAKEIADLNNLEVTLDFVPLKLSELGEGDLSAFEASSLRFLFDV